MYSYCIVPATGPQICTALSLATLWLVFAVKSTALSGNLFRIESSSFGNAGSTRLRLILEIFVTQRDEIHVVLLLKERWRRWSVHRKPILSAQLKPKRDTRYISWDNTARLLGWARTKVIVLGPHCTRSNGKAFLDWKRIWGFQVLAFYDWISQVCGAHSRVLTR